MGPDTSGITQNLPENQCVFVRGYRVVRIPNTWLKFLELMGPLHMRRRPGPGSDQRLQLTSIPEGLEVSKLLIFCRAGLTFRRIKIPSGFYWSIWSR